MILVDHLLANDLITQAKTDFDQSVSRFPEKSQGPEFTTYAAILFTSDSFSKANFAPTANAVPSMKPPSTQK
jgi:hypothetical protein